MARVACVHVPALPLQLLLARHPEWAERPAAVVDRDSPQGRILWVNGRARRRRILPGMRYAAALSLAGDLGTRGRSKSADRGLVAGTVEPAEIEAAVEELTHRLLTLTPGVEPAADEPGVFFLDATGLDRLWPSIAAWAEAVAAVVAGGTSGYRAVAVVVGFTRFGTYTVARGVPGRLAQALDGRGVTVFNDREAERRAAGRVRLARLGVDPELRDALDRLGITTVDELRRLPEGGLAERFGAQARRLHRLACDSLAEPLTPERPPEPLGRSTDLEQPDGDATRLLFLLKRLLDPLLGELAQRGEPLASLAFTLRLEDGSRRRETLQPARPTRDGPQLLELIRLRLEGIDLPHRIEEVRLEVASGPVPDAGGWGKGPVPDAGGWGKGPVPDAGGWGKGPVPDAGGRGKGPVPDASGWDQLELFPVNARRDPEAGARALARLKAELGDTAVVRARLADRWMPEGAFLWEPVARLEPPTPGDTSTPRLVRRILTRPRPLPPQPRHLRDDGWLIRGAGHGAVTRLVGPYTLSGGWWFGGAHRDYYFAETRLGELLWVYLDRQEDRWFLQGSVA